MNAETLRWRGGRLELLDQRALPQRVEYLVCGTAAEVAAAIRDMVVRGAPAIGCAAAYGIALAAQAAADEPLDSAFTMLAASRPTAVNLFWALDRMRAARDACRDQLPHEIAARLAAEAVAIHQEDIGVNRSIGRHGAALVPDGARILTHCNA